MHVKKELGRQLRNKLTTIISTGASQKAERRFEEVFINSFNYLSMDYKGLLYCFYETPFKADEHFTNINNQLRQIL